MTAVTRRLLAGLDARQLTAVLFGFGDAERADWHYIPRRRRGLPFADLNPAQRGAVRDLFAATLSDSGLARLDGVIALERVLQRSEGAFRDPDRYFLTVFGLPGAYPWGWRFEGHHLSLNVACAAPEAVAVTPAFFGANPARVRSGPEAGLRVLGAEEDLARAVLRELSPDLRARAIIADRSMGDIVAGPQRDADLGAPRGVALGALSGAPRAAAEALLDRHLAAFARDIAYRQRRRVREAGVERLHFAWAGSPDEGKAHYFRLHGPITLVEHDNTQNDANHVHSVWRDLAEDFGPDALGEHYRRLRHR